MKTRTIKVKANVSAYCSCVRCCERWSKFRTTASGHKIVKGDHFIAAPKSYPFGTIVRIPSYNNGKNVPVLDRGGAIKGNRFDVFFPTHQEALKFGRQFIEIEIEIKD